MRVRLTVVVSSLIAALLPLSPVAAGTGEQVRGGPTPSVTWTPCADDPTADCGTLAVPIDWARPRGATIDLALVRRKATDPAARVGSLVVNPGGPGGSGVDAVLERLLTFSPEVTRRFDLVGFDPRGVARSHPVVCSAALAYQAPDPLALRSQADFAALVAYNQRLREDCRVRTGPLADHVDTLSVVRDLDAIRAALGDEKLTYYGVSYGTLIGQLYAERFPGRVRALALDSNMDHSLGTGAFLDTETATVQDSFDEFVSWCDRTETCALHGKDVRALWAGLIARADRGELPFPGYPSVSVSRTQLLSQVFVSFYEPAWSQLADLLVALDSGSQPTVSPAVSPAVSPPAVSPPAELSRQEDEVVQDPAQVFCEDYFLPVRDFREYAAHLSRAARIAPDMRISPLAISLIAACLGQPTPIPDPQHRLRVAPNAQVLLGNAVHDPATPYVWAASTARQMGRAAVLLTYEGWGHRVYGRGDCTTGAFERYLVSRTLPARGTRCPAVPPAEATLRRAPWPVPSGPVPGLPGWRFRS
ncbi:alpha/beta hydrolase [Microbispora rosea]|uniref:alpha/beta hydrolase n=1 Tax=Microbispora rosea TaxID=58117 RepID=UPI00341C398B